MGNAPVPCMCGDRLDYLVTLRRAAGSLLASASPHPRLLTADAAHDRDGFELRADLARRLGTVDAHLVSIRAEGPARATTSRSAETTKALFETARSIGRAPDLGS